MPNSINEKEKMDANLLRIYVLPEWQEQVSVVSFYLSLSYLAQEAPQASQCEKNNLIGRGSMISKGSYKLRSSISNWQGIPRWWNIGSTRQNRLDNWKAL
jgi:hypothetical protein